MGTGEGLEAVEGRGPLRCQLERAGKADGVWEWERCWRWERTEGRGDCGCGQLREEEDRTTGREEIQVWGEGGWREDRAIPEIRCGASKRVAVTSSYCFKAPQRSMGVVCSEWYRLRT